QVAKGEPLAEVETDKADVELEASDSGVLSEIKVQEGQSAAVGAVIAVLAAAGEAGASAGGDSTRPAGAVSAAPAARAAGRIARRGAPPARPSREGTSRGAARNKGDEQRTAEATDREPVAGDAAADHPVRASPLAWRLADEAGVNLAGVRGS